MMTALRKENWINYLSELPTNQTQNEHMADILNLVSYHQGAKTILEKIQKNPGLTLLLVDGFSELVLLHHLDCLPANVFRTEDRLVALNGYTSKADCFRIDPETAFRDLEFQTPVWRDLKSVGTKDAVQNLQAPDQASTSFKGKQVMIVPPLVSLAILEAKTVQPGELIPILSAKFQEFDRVSQTVKACTVLRPVLEFLWAVHHKKVPSTVIGLDTNSDTLAWASKLHMTCINPLVPPPFPIPPPPPGNLPQDQGAVNSIVGELRLLRDAQDKQHLREISLDEEKKNGSNGWEKFPEEVQTMILRMSAVSDEALPTTPADSYLKVLKQSKAFAVAMVLNLGLSMKGCQTEVPLAMANAVKTGNFRANSQLVIHAFSIFNLPYVEDTNMSNFNQIDVDILLTKGEGVPKEIAKKLQENRSKCPDNTHYLRHQLNNWYGMLQICFGKEALITREARAWIDHVDKFERSYDARFKTVADFGAKVLGLIDLTFYQFCDSCLRATSFEDVDFAAIAQEHERYSITKNTFQANIPAHLVIQQKRKSDPEQDDSDEESKKKRQKALKEKEDKDKHKYKDLGNMVKNQQQVAEWKILGSKYKKHFTKEVMLTTPLFNETGLVTCNKWHLQGFCYEKCDRKASHKPFVSAPHKALYDKWVKEQKSQIP
jgi:hypothetical protein